MKPEQRLWQLIKPHVPGDNVRIESVTGSGIPDVNFCSNGREAWIENKVKTIYRVNIGDSEDTLESILRETQLSWHWKRVKNGGIVYVCNRDKDIITLWRCYGFRKYTLLLVLKKPFDWNKFTEALEGED